MGRVKSPFPREWTFDDVLRQLGNIPPSRVRADPLPGTATEEDVLVLNEEGRLCELVDGVLVEKTMGYSESKLAFRIGYLLQQYLDEHDLGELSGPDGTLRLMPNLIRIPDVAFVSHQRAAECPTADKPMPDLAPELAIEVLSEGNTEGEMERKNREYFFAGAKLVWLVDPRTRTIEVFTAPDQSVTFRDGDELTGEPVLPGLRLPVATVFAKLPPVAPKRRRGKKKP
jgi:Uma2 family endonuclease